MKPYLRVIIIILSWFLVLSANTIRVPQDQPGIQAGINAAFPGDTVLVADSTYFENIDFKGKAITVASYYLFDGDTTHVDSTIIDGSQPVNPDVGSVVSFVSGEDTTSVLYGFTITGGSGSWFFGYNAWAGGGITCDYSGGKIVANKIINNSVTGPVALGGGLAAIPMGSNAYVVLEDNQIAHNIVTANSFYALGGGLLLNSNAKLTANVISYNTCIADSNSLYAEGGGISLQPGEPLYYREIIMENNTITHNSISNYDNNIPAGTTAAWGGGVGLHRCSGRMIKNKVCYNEIWNYSNTGVAAIGVGVQVSPDSFLVEGNIIHDNAYQQTTGTCYGGGLVIGGTGVISVSNNLIEGNDATHGGGVQINHNIANPGTALLVNNTIVNNSATYGGGIHINDANGYVMNTIIWGNQAATNAGIHIESGSLNVAYSDIQGDSKGAGNIDKDPRLEADSLLNDSPCIGTGIVSYDFGGGMTCHCPSTDINGRSRPYPAGTRPDMGAWESLLDTTVGIKSMPIATVPQEYSLSQNYPNPFNPSTTIEFTLPKTVFVILKVYNLLGEEVATLVSEKLSAGKYKYLWDASYTGGMASGVYLYRLHAGEFKKTKKLILMK